MPVQWPVATDPGFPPCAALQSTILLPVLTGNHQDTFVTGPLRLCRSYYIQMNFSLILVHPSTRCY